MQRRQAIAVNQRIAEAPASRTPSMPPDCVRRLGVTLNTVKRYDRDGPRQMPIRRSACLACSYIVSWSLVMTMGAHCRIRARRMANGEVRVVIRDEQLTSSVSAKFGHSDNQELYRKPRSDNTLAAGSARLSEALGSLRLPNSSHRGAIVLIDHWWGCGRLAPHAKPDWGASLPRVNNSKMWPRLGCVARVDPSAA